MAFRFTPSVVYPSTRVYHLESPIRRSEIWRKWCIGASSAAPGVDLEALNAAIAKIEFPTIYHVVCDPVTLCLLPPKAEVLEQHFHEDKLLQKDSDSVKDALDQLNGAGWARKWSSQPYVSRRTTSLRELTTLGIKNAENLAIPSVRNDAALLSTVVGTTGLLAVLAGRLPGDWGFFVPYLIGSIPLIVLAVGSISPGLLQAAIVGFSSFFPDYQERIVRHEAAHFLVAYLIGLPILDYSLDIGKEHVNLGDERLQQLIYAGNLDDKGLDRLAVVSMAGLAAEGLQYDKVVGQSADLFSLQRFFNRTKPSLSKEKQQNLTRWAVLFAGSLLKNNRSAHEALMSAMSKKASVLDCIKAIENAS